MESLEEQLASLRAQLNEEAASAEGSRLELSRCQELVEQQAARIATLEHLLASREDSVAQLTAQLDQMSAQVRCFRSQEPRGDPVPR